MKVLSLFDGMSCGRIALSNLGITPSHYISSEIDKDAIKVSSDNFTDIIRVGDIRKISYKDGVLYTSEGDYELNGIDLLIGGSPCQDFSLLNTKGLGLKGDKSSLFYEYLRLKEEINPTNFLLENVRMKESSKLELDKYLGVEGVNINSRLFSFQNRPRIYWTSLPIPLIVDKGVSFQDHKEVSMVECSRYRVKRTPSRERMWGNGGGYNNRSSCKNVTHEVKVNCLTLKQDRAPNSGLVQHEDFCRFLTQKELELAQTVPVGYTNCLSYPKAQKVLGNGWTVDVISHILSSLKT